MRLLESEMEGISKKSVDCMIKLSHASKDRGKGGKIRHGVCLKSQSGSEKERKREF